MCSRARKHRYTANKMDFTFNRICDLHPVGNRVEGGLVVSVITPLADDYETSQDGKCILESSQEGGQVIIRLADDESLGREIRTYLKTEKYLRTKDDGTLPAGTNDPPRSRRRQPRTAGATHPSARGHLTEAALLRRPASAWRSRPAHPMAALDEALEYLIKNTFTKMSFLENLHGESAEGDPGLLRSDDVAQQTLDLQLPGEQPAGHRRSSHLHRALHQDQPQIVLHDMIKRVTPTDPTVGPPMEVVLLSPGCMSSAKSSL